LDDSADIDKSIKREDFPILDLDVYDGKRLIYLDSAASSQKPVFVINEMDSYYRSSHSNVHRGAHALANRATEKYEAARDSVAKLINAPKREEIIFTRGATDAINLVSQSWTQRLQPGDEIILSVMEHHSNIVPWQMAAQKTGAVLKFVPLTASETFDLKAYHSLLCPRTKLVAVAHASNVLGTVNPVHEIITSAHSLGARVLLDACQSVPHMSVDVQALDVDFLVASSHKMCGPTGIGFLYGKHDILLSMPPVVGGGEMIDQVTLKESTYAPPPSRFEAGTPPIAEAVGLGAAVDYLLQIGMDKIYRHETHLGKYLYERLANISGLRLYGPSPQEAVRTGLVAFNSDTVHASDLAFFLDQEGCAIRTGHHCAQPLHSELGAKGSARASLYFYNSKQDIDDFIQKLEEVLQMFSNLENS